MLELFVLALGLSMDAFAVSICKGLSAQKPNLKSAVTVGLYFGAFQAAMPVIGYLIGAQFADKIRAMDHWIAFVLLGVIGAKMIKDGLDASGDSESSGGDASTGPRAMIPMAVATSIDALALGVSFAFLDVSIGRAAALIGVTTFILSMLGVGLGRVFGAKSKSRAEVSGGVALVLIGAKILFEHLGLLPW